MIGASIQGAPVFCLKTFQNSYFCYKRKTDNAKLRKHDRIRQKNGSK